jgi:hypothetical protein
VKLASLAGGGRPGTLQGVAHVAYSFNAGQCGAVTMLASSILQVTIKQGDL